MLKQLLQSIIDRIKPCQHQWIRLDGYVNLGWFKCNKCQKEKYNGKKLQFTHFDLGTWTIKSIK